MSSEESSFKTRKIDNLELHDEEGYVAVSVNPVFYPLDIVYSACYIFLDRAYILLGGDPEEEIIVELRPKNPQDIESLGRDFNNELLNYAVFSINSEKTRPVKEAIVSKALATNLIDEFEEPGSDDDKVDTNDDDSDSDGLDYIDDPLGIAVPWEEKYGKDQEKDESDSCNDNE
ncbi:hypothetical protein JXB41_03285 [Candidatus Woesearchaeota archaeon]|nr:hypothetical protein [Candidatus Woesearchaeota archaeon]